MKSVITPGTWRISIHVSSAQHNTGPLPLRHGWMPQYPSELSLLLWLSPTIRAGRWGSSLACWGMSFWGKNLCGVSWAPRQRDKRGVTMSPPWNQSRCLSQLLNGISIPIPLPIPLPNNQIWMGHWRLWSLPSDCSCSQLSLSFVFVI